MGEYEPHDSRNITLRQDRAPGEPPRTGPREQEARERAGQAAELDTDGRGEAAEQTVPAADQAGLREQAMDRDTEELSEAERDRRTQGDQR
jgi:hypothetical protein